ncbi:MAG: DUF5916 domain-containing protein [Acidobacteriota bacterium]
MKKLKFIPILISIILTGSYSIYSADIVLKAAKVSETVKIDGVLDEKIWSDSEVFSGFKMVEPETGLEPSEKTELRVLYDQSNMYIGVRCFSNNIGDISVNTLKHDQHSRRSRGDDLIKILIDPFLDKRNAYVFFVNPKGARTDGLASGEHYSTNWDGIWDASARIDKEGWNVEIKIPFKTLSFNSGLKEWGINVERYIAKKMETIRLSGISKDSFFFNPAEASYLNGINNIKQGLGITFKPYMTLVSSKDTENGGKREWKIDGGFDLYKSFTPNLTGVFTYNTDFAETEVDERKINLTRFSLFYPEKRSFFLEGSEIFTFGSGLYRTFVPFFSRKIGIFDEEFVPVNYGMKVYGKIGKTNLGLLNVRTGSTDSVNGKSFIAGRIYQNIFDQSKVGLIFTKGDPESENPNSLLGIDFNYSSSKFLKNKNFSAGGWWVYNWNTIEEGKHYGYGFKIDYPNDLWDAAITYSYFGDSLEPGLSYLPRNNVQVIRPMIMFKPRPKNGFIGKLIRQFYLEFFGSIYLDLDGNVISSRIFTAPVNFRTEGGDHFEFNIIHEKEVLEEVFELSDDVVFAPGSYDFTRYRMMINSASHRKIDLSIRYTFGNFYSGKLGELDIGTSFKYKGNINFNIGALFLRGDFPQGRYRKNLFRIKGDFFLNPDIGLMSFIQYDDDSRELGANIRLKWRISPGNIIYLVYNKNWERSWDPASRFNTIMDRGIFKIQLSWRP